MKTHELKTIQPHFEHVRSGAKSADIRRNDRGFAVGDVLFLREYDPAGDSYSGRFVEALVTHVLAEYEALAPGFVMLSIKTWSSGLYEDGGSLVRECVTCGYAPCKCDQQ